MFAKTDYPGFVKHTQTKAVVNADKTALTGYRKRRDQFRQQKGRISKLETDVAHLKSMVETLLRSR
jgi:ribosomal protein L13